MTRAQSGHQPAEPRCSHFTIHLFHSKSLKRGLQPTRAASAGKNPQWAIRARSGHQPAKPRCAHFTTHLIITTPIPPQGTNKRLNAGASSSPTAPHGTDKRRKTGSQFTSSSGTDKCPTLAGTPSSSPPQGTYKRLQSTDPLSANRPAFNPLAAGALHPLNRANCARSGHQPAAPLRRSLHPFYTTRPPSVLYTIYHKLSLQHDVHAPPQKTCRRV